MSPILTVVLVLLLLLLLGRLVLPRRREPQAHCRSQDRQRRRGAKRIVNDAIKAAEQKRKGNHHPKRRTKPSNSRATPTRKSRIAAPKSPPGAPHRPERGSLDKRTTQMERKEEDLKRRSETVEARLDELEQLKLRQTEKLETIAAMSKEDARAVLLKRVDDELTHEKAMKISAYQANMKDECDNLARELVGQAIAAARLTPPARPPSALLPLPSDEMKGRIIGRGAATSVLWRPPPA